MSNEQMELRMKPAGR